MQAQTLNKLLKFIDDWEAGMITKYGREIVADSANRLRRELLKAKDISRK